jgi:hypothetical protein
VSPTLSELSDTLESFAAETLGKKIGQLISGGNFMNFNI